MLVKLNLTGLEITYKVKNLFPSPSMKGAEATSGVRYPLTIAMTFQDSERTVGTSSSKPGDKHYRITQNKSFMYHLVQNQMTGIISLLRNIQMNISQMIQIHLKQRMV